MQSEKLYRVESSSRLELDTDEYRVVFWTTQPRSTARRRKWHTLTDCFHSQRAISEKPRHMPIHCCHKMEKHSINSTAICFSLFIIYWSDRIDWASEWATIHRRIAEGNAFSCLNFSSSHFSSFLFFHSFDRWLFTKAFNAISARMCAPYNFQIINFLLPLPPPPLEGKMHPYLFFHAFHSIYLLYFRLICRRLFAGIFSLVFNRLHIPIDTWFSAAARWSVHHTFPIWNLRQESKI